MENNQLFFHSTAERKFGMADYIVFSATLILSAAIGFYHAVKDRKQTNVDNFQLGNREMHYIPVSLSMAATSLSALTLIGIPSEVYTYGTMIMWTIAAYFFAILISGHFFIPMFYNLKLTSCFEYLDLRFGKAVRVVASLAFLLQSTVYLAFVIYIPSLALETVVPGLSLWGCVVGVTAICTLYTALGGMKTVIWTDSLQILIIISGLLCLLIMGSDRIGGFGNAWEIADNKGRIQFGEISPDPRTRHTVWSVAVGGTFTLTAFFGIHQAQVQRACSLPSLKNVKQAAWINFAMYTLLFWLTAMIGIVIFAAYSECHPVLYGIINRSDQMVPLFVLDVFKEYPGLSGLFLSGIFSGSLSTLSSYMNATSAILMEDILKPFCCKTLADRKGIILAKTIVIVLGIILLGLSVAASVMERLVFQLVYSFTSIFMGPLLGTYVSGMFFPWTNHAGAFVGFCTSLIFMAWLCFGSIIERPSGTAPLPFSTQGCNWNDTGISTTVLSTYASTSISSQLVSTNSSTAVLKEDEFLDDFYRVSYMWYSCFGMLANIAVSLAVSLVTGCTKPSSLDGRLICPVFDILLPCLPESIRKPLRFGVIHDKHSKDINLKSENTNETKNPPNNIEIYKF